jgi:soluble lytic murein transglycosylase-like protein
MPLNKAIKYIIPTAFAIISAITMLGSNWTMAIYKDTPTPLDNHLKKTSDWYLVEELQSPEDQYTQAFTSYMDIAKSEDAAPVVRYLNATFGVPTETSFTILAAALKYSKKHDIPLEMVLAIIEEESDFNPHARSHVGARGLMQVMPLHKKLIHQHGGTVDKLWNPEFNIKIGTLIYKDALRSSQGDTREALARYNGSWGKSDRYSTKVLKTKQRYNALLEGINLEKT